MLKSLFKKFEKLLLVVVLFTASFYRLYGIRDYMTFLGDEGRDMLVVYKILHGDLTLLGPTASVGGFFLGPIYYYFMTPFLWLFNYDPVGPSVMVAIFGIATVWLIYKVGKEFFGSFVGLVAAGLYAISPLVVIYSRSSWNPNPMPFFSLLLLYVIYKAVLKNSNKLFLLSGFILGVALQLHYLAVFLGTIVFFYVLINRYFLFGVKEYYKAIKQYLFIFLGFVMGWSPFLAFELRHDFTNIVSIFSFIFKSGDTGGSGHFLDTTSNVFFRIFGRLVTNFPSPEQVALGAHFNMAVWYYATLLLGIISTLILFLKTVKVYKERSNDFAKFSLLVIWLVLGVGFFGFYKKPIYDYYFGFMFPLPFLIIGFFLKNIWQKLPGKILATSIIIILIILNSTKPPFKASANRQVDQIEEIAKFVVDKAGNEPFNFALITGGNSDHAYRYFFTLWNKDPSVILNEQTDPERKSVTDQLLVICEIDTTLCYPLGNPLWEIAGFGRAEVVEEWNVSLVKVYRLTHYK